MSRRLASVAAVLLLTACNLPFADTPPPEFGFISITSAGEPLVGGSDDVTPTLDLRLHGEVAFADGDVRATLDSKSLPITTEGGDATARVAPMPLGSSHHLNVSITGRAQAIDIDFSVIPPTEAQLAAHVDPSTGLIVDAAFAGAPSQAAVAAALPGATVTWVDSTHARITWQGPRPASISLPGTIVTARGSHLAGPVSLSLGGLSTGMLRRAVVPAPPALGATNLLAFVVDTAAANTSMARHESALKWISPTGWQAQADGSILGTPDESAVARAQAAGIPIWPSLANDATDPTAVASLLSSAQAESQLITTVVNSVVDAGFAGVNLDFEGMPGQDKAPFTAFVKQLAQALHAQQAKLIVDVVPHDASGVNQFSAAYDLPALAGLADYIDLMAYDQHGDGGSPGPVAGLDWDKAVLAASMPGLTPSHTLLGIPLYARYWATTGSGAGAYEDLVPSALAVAGARIDYDFGAETPFIESPDTSYLTYFDDAASLADKIALAQQQGFAGVAAWRLGFEDPAFWSLF